ncbi:helix-turn-helix transcriptional regulator [Legionella sp. D16C41]|uniref:helix-turn-helix transcriptional regulator n=1 Tax=Legionella sp. D16C41 TaxID=3402688 RepID=UPI003AF50D59
MDLSEHTQLWLQVPGFAAMKNLQREYIICNNNLAEVMQLKSPHHIQGLTDFKLLDYSEENYAFHYQNDVRALKGETINCLHYSSWPYNGTYYYFIKKPLINSEQAIIGLLYQCIPLTQSNFIKKIIAEDEKTYTKGKKLRAYYIGTVTNPFGLTPRELECLFFTLRALTAKQIAMQLSLSKRSVEFYLENIKNKMGCSSKSELICLGISHGYLNYIPPSLLHQQNFQII